jgi:hypothetical protein
MERVVSARVESLTIVVENVGTGATWSQYDAAPVDLLHLRTGVIETLLSVSRGTSGVGEARTVAKLRVTENSPHPYAFLFLIRQKYFVPYSSRAALRTAVVSVESSITLAVNTESFATWK